MAEFDSFLDDILIIIVLYKQSLTDSESFKSIHAAIGQSSRLSLFIYDNSPKACVIPELNSLVVNYHHDPSNPGVSKAYNEGFNVANRLKKKWLLLVDQDTTFPSTLFSDYWRAVQDYPQIAVFVPSLRDSSGLLSPFRLIWGKGRRVKSIRKPIQNFKDFKIINSGIFLSLKAFERANGYDERFPLDYSDISFCDRLYIADPNFALIPARCIHNFSGTNDSGGDLPIDLGRFNSFCGAVLLYKKTSCRFISPGWVILPRALKLSLKLMTFKFLKIGARHVLRSS